MTERSTDIEFDFFEDEPPTQEASRRIRPRVPRRDGNGPGGPPRRPVRPPAGFTPLLRLVGLIAFAIVLVVLLVLWIGSCRSEDRVNSYRTYMDSMRTVAQDSSQVGRDLSTALTTPGVKPAELQETLGGLAQQQEQDVARARELVAPGHLREQHGEAVEALQFRASGLRQLQDAFQRATNVDQATEIGGLLASPMRRLMASDIVWDDQFVASSQAVMEQEGIRGVEVPDSNFLTNFELASEEALNEVFERVAGAQQDGQPTGLHGNALVSVKAVPSGEVLQREQDNFIVATADLAFEVTVENSGDGQEVGVEVRLIIQQSPQPIRKTAKIDLIAPGERKTVTFKDLGQIVQFAQKTTVTAEVAPVPGEENFSNNKGAFPVTFTLTPP